MISRYTKNAVILGLLTAIGPFAIDMYLPALPTIAADLHASTAATQMTLMTFFIAFGVSQIVFGPLSDMVGRKPPLYAGLALFFIGSVGCALGVGIEWLIFFRFVQGVGASSAMVIPRAIIRDLHTGVEATKLMSLCMLVLSVSPILAPLIGSALIVPFGWRAVFVAVTLVSVVSFTLVFTGLSETLSPGNRTEFSLRAMLRGFRTLFRDRHFLGLTFIGGLGMSSFFAFIASSSFIYINHFGLTPTQYSFTFSVNAIGFIGMSQLTARLGTRFGMGRLVLTAVTGFAFFAVLLGAVTLFGVDRLWVLIAGLFLAFSCLGLVVPSTMVLALDAHGPIAGLASALGGTLQMIVGGMVIAVTSLVFDGTPLPMVAVIAILSVGALTISLMTLRGRELAAHAAE